MPAVIELQEVARVLLLLDRLDHERWEAEQELARTPREISVQETALGVQRTALQSVRDELAATQASVRDNEGELAAVEGKAKRADKRLTMVFTSTQIDATKRELATLAERRDELEELILEAMDRAETLEADATSQASALDQATAAFADRTGTWSTREGALRSRVAELTEQREPLFSGLRSDVARRYQVGWKLGRFSPPSALTSAKGDGVCLTCHASLSFKWLSEARRHAAVHACDNCKRIIVFDPDAGPVTGDVEPDGE